MSRLEEIMDIFRINNKSTTPVAIIEDGTSKNERIVIGTVNDIAYRAQFANLGNPSIIVVGEVVKFQQSAAIDIIQNKVMINQLAIKKEQ